MFFLTPCVRFCLFYLMPTLLSLPLPPPSPSPAPPPAPPRALLSTLRSPPACGAVVHSPRTRLGAWISGRWPCGAVVHSPRARLGAWISGRWPCTFCYIKFFSASGEAILGTQRYLYVRSQYVLLYKIFSRLRRGHFRYTTISCMYVHSTFCYIKFFRASGEAILGTQRYLDDLFRARARARAHA